VPSLCRRLGLKGSDERVLKQLLKSEEFSNFAKTKLNNAECRLLGLGEKRIRKHKKKEIKPVSFGDF